MATVDFSRTHDTSFTHRELLTSAQAAKYLGVNYQWLAQARMRGESPTFIKYGNAQNAPVRYDISDLHTWLDHRRFGSTAEAAESNFLARRNK